VPWTQVDIASRFLDFVAVLKMVGRKIGKKWKVVV
jgi:hypothetical protein